jgi:hypothetical protein
VCDSQKSATLASTISPRKWVFMEERADFSKSEPG